MSVSGESPDSFPSSAQSNNTFRAQPHKFFNLNRRRLNEELFNECAPFGEEDNSPNNETSLQVSSLEESEEIFTERYRMPPEYFIRLFAQSIVLDSFISQDFPRGTIRTWVKYILETQIQAFCTNFFKTSQGSQAVREFFDLIEKNLQNFTKQIEQWQKTSHKRPIVSTGEIKRFKSQYEDLVRGLNSHFNTIEKAIEEIADQSPLNQKLVTGCLSIVEQEHHRGKEWAKAFFEFIDIKKAKLYITHREVSFEYSNRSHTQIETMSNNSERYILFTFSPQDFLVAGCILLAFRFFHEYISHLDAAIYPQKKNDEVQIEIDSHELIPLELSEGWMIHTAQVFFEERAFDLLGPSRQHLREDVSNELASWISGLMKPESQAYIRGAERGLVLAGRFFNFLKEEICEGDGERARRLYYRMSFDLITRYPLEQFFHLDFLDALESALQSEPVQLREIIQSCLVINNDNNDMEIIDLDNLWSKLKNYMPSIDLPEQ